MDIKALAYREDRRWHVKLYLPEWSYVDVLADQEAGKALTVIGVSGEFLPNGGFTYYANTRRFMGVARIEEQTEKKVDDGSFNNQVLEVRYIGGEWGHEYRAILPGLEGVQLSESDYTQIIDIVTKAMQRASESEAPEFPKTPYYKPDPNERTTDM